MMEVYEVLEKYFTWILHLLVAFVFIISAFHSPVFSWAFLMIIFCAPIKWKSWENAFRISLFYLSSLILVVSLAMTYGLTVNQYIAAVLMLMFMATALLLTRTGWKIPMSLDVHTFTLSLVFIVGIVTFLELGDQRYHILCSLSVLISILMFIYLGASIRRAEIVSCIGDPQRFEEGLKKLAKEEVKLRLIRIRFNEFLKYVEAGMLENAYVTLSTGLLEAIGIWREKKDKEPKYRRKSIFHKYDEIRHRHEDIRGAIVHSIPKRKEEWKDAGDLLKIVEDFKKKPFVAICDLLYATKKRIESIK